MQVAWAILTDPTTDGCRNCPANPLLIEGHAQLADAISAVQSFGGIAVIAATVVLVFRHWRRSEARERRALAPVVFTGGLAFLLVLVQLTLSAAGAPHSAELVTFIAAIAVFACLPVRLLSPACCDSRISRAEEISSELSAENEQLNAALQAKVAELQASRARIVRAGDQERRRLERDLHDGAQQRLVALALTLRLARGRTADPAVAALLDEASAELAARHGGAARARARHPPRRARRPRPRPGVGTLAGRSAVPVEVAELPAERFPPGVESAAYFLVAEALTNVARYARATHAAVAVRRVNGSVTVEVRDDGVGGADPAAGSGLRGLADRVAALDGRLEVDSPAGAGTTVRAVAAVRVVIAEDSALLRAGLVRLLEDAGCEVVGQAADAEDLLRKVRAHRPDVALTDIRMPPTHTDEGLRAALVIREELPDTGVLVLSQYVDEAYAFELLAGSTEGVGYLLKDRVADVDALLEAVRRVAAGGTALDPEVVTHLLGRRRRDDPLAALTPREREVLGLMAEGRSNRAIADALVVTERAVEKHVTSIFGKLGLPASAADHRRVLAVLRFLDQPG